MKTACYVATKIKYRLAHFVPEKSGYLIDDNSKM